jgi:hypothetical protein
MDNRKALARLRTKLADWKRDWRLLQLNRQISNNAHPKPESPTVAFFVASTRLTGISLNAAFDYLTACGLQLAGSPVVYFACQAGMSHCVMGTKWSDPYKQPPCQACIAQSQRLFAHAPTLWFSYQEDEDLKRSLESLSISELSNFTFTPPRGVSSSEDIPLGRLVLPSIRWALRLHHLPEDESTRYLFREYILSAWRVANEFTKFLEQTEPQVIVLFNGVLFPEAIARWVAQKHTIRVITHEVGFKPFSAFFTNQEVTAYPLDIPEDHELTSEENQCLDDYLEKRFQGQFTMAGIRFWPEMRGLDKDFLRKASQYKQIVPVFSNVIYDTSQIHASTIFPNMFAWLDLVAEIFTAQTETLFVLRAHPDEQRPGKLSRESVQDWYKRNDLENLQNFIFVDSREFLSSYELIQRSKFVMVYNSSIGLEAVLMGKAVLCGGTARYTPYNTVYSPESPQEYRSMAEEFLTNDKEIEVPPEFLINARRLMYFQVFKASLSFDEFLEEHTIPGYVHLKPFGWRDLQPENSQTIQTLVNGILYDEPFLISDEY